MDNRSLKKKVNDRARVWLGDEFDEKTRNQVKNLLEGPENELIDAFYQDLEFGTGGLRGIMGAGTNRINEYTISMATQGLANYLVRQFSHLTSIKVAIAYDCRNNSRLYAETAANIFTANDIDVLLFDKLRPTPELSFAIRHYGCQSGLVITASHNPKEYNGYKVYWEDGGQIIAPHDKNIISHVQKITSFSQVRTDKKESRITMLGSETDKIYLEKVKEMSLSPEINKKWKNLKIVFTPIHGTAVEMVPAALEMYGFKNIINIPDQDITDGNFPTVKSPNPEEAAALQMALDMAVETDADLVMGTDPDGDRVGIAVKNHKGEFELLNGNQIASLLLYYVLTRWKELGRLSGNEYIVKTIVTSELLANIAEKFGVECFDVLTGFKFIAGLMRKNEGEKTFIAGFEESYGYLVGDFVRDKDAIVSCALIAEATAWAHDQGKTLFDLLMELYSEFGLYRESLLSIVRKGKAGADEIAALMEKFRNSPPLKLNGSPVMLVNDYLKQKSFDTINELRRDIDLPKSNVLQFFLKDGTVISMRPSGTEPKIKFYIGVRAPFSGKENFDSISDQLAKKTSSIIEELGVN
ncbi:MAG: phospho-sugar mutase [Bacteroidales bacterium]